MSPPRGRRATEEPPRERLSPGEAGDGSPARRRVLFVSYTAEWTGPAKSLHLLLGGLRGRFDVAVVFPGDGPVRTALEAEGIEQHVIPVLDKWSIPRLVRLIRDGGFDLVYANNTHGSSKNAILAAAFAGVPSVCHVRAMEWDKSWWRLWFLRLPAAVVAVSRACADSVRRFVRGGRLHVVYNGVPPSKGVAAPGNGLREGLRVPGDAPLLLSVSHVCQRKGQHLLLEAMARLRHLVAEDVHLCILGSLEREPEYVGRLREAIDREGLSGRVHLCGFHENVAGALRDATIFVHSAVADPHPRAVIEAMAAGLPVVAFAVDGVAETVLDGRTGRLVDSGDATGMAAAIAELLERKEERRRMGAAGRARVAEVFTAEATARRVGELIDEVLTGRERARG